MMLYKSFVFLLLMMPFFVKAQHSQPWSLFVNETKLLSSSVDSVASVELSKKSQGNIEIVFAKRDTSFNRTVLLVNKTRQLFLQDKITATHKTASFLVENVLTKSSAKAFVICIVDVPSNPAKAMLVRVAPVTICNVEWK